MTAREHLNIVWKTATKPTGTPTETPTWTETGTMVSMGHNQIVLTYIAHTGCLPALKTFTMKPFSTQHSTHQRTGIDQIKSSWKTTQL